MTSPHLGLLNTQTSQPAQPASSFQDRYVPHSISLNRNQSIRVPSSFGDTYTVHPADQPPPYISVKPLPPLYPNT